jgi:phage shock protein C
MSGYCSNCGTVLPPGARFCSVCGTVTGGFPPPGYPPPGYSPYAPRLLRPLFGRQVAGVCIGFARTYGWDVGLVRILTVIGGIFLLPIMEIVYLACWIGIPEEPPATMQPTGAQNSAPPPQS